MGGRWHHTPFPPLSCGLPMFVSNRRAQPQKHKYWNDWLCMRLQKSENQQSPWNHLQQPQATNRVSNWFRKPLIHGESNPIYISIFPDRLCQFAAETQIEKRSKNARKPSIERQKDSQEAETKIWKFICSSGETWERTTYMRVIKVNKHLPNL